MHPVFTELLRLAVENGASDIVVKSDLPGLLRLEGRLRPVEMEPIARRDVENFVEESLPPVHRRVWEEQGQIDFSFEVDGLGRFRVNGFRQRGSVSLVFRFIRSEIPTFEELNLQPDVMTRLAQHKDGIVLVCGPTGSGKSSTLACMLEWINQNLDRHIVTLEDPIEFNFRDGRSVFNQREIGIDAPSFSLALKSVLRQSPDVILIGEMRDQETFETALAAAETGHLVLTTLHASNAHQAVCRLFEFFPADQQAQARRQLAGALRGVVVQRLIPAMEGGGRIPALEVLVADSVVRTLIAEGNTDKLPAFLEAAGDTGSHSFNRDLYRLIKAGLISKGDGLKFSQNPQALEMNLKGIFFSDGKRILG
jgi:twitching motility protein PilT